MIFIAHAVTVNSKLIIALFRNGKRKIDTSLKTIKLNNLSNEYLKIIKEPFKSVFQEHKKNVASGKDGF